jgi:hypothetical protein
MPLSKITNPFLAPPNTRISSNSANTINVSLGGTTPTVSLRGYFVDSANNGALIGISNINPTRQLDIGGFGTSAEMNFTAPGTAPSNGRVWNFVVDGATSTRPANFTLRRLTDDGTSELSGFGFTANGTSGIFSTRTVRGISPASVPAGSVIQVVQHSLSSIGLFSSSGNSAELDVTNSSRTFTPLYSTSKVLHIITIGLKFVCDGRIYIRRGGSNVSPSLGDQWREMSWDATVDMGPTTMQYLDSPATTSEITYSLRVQSSGCSNTIAVGNSGDFTPYWTMMEIAA